MVLYFIMVTVKRILKIVTYTLNSKMNLNSNKFVLNLSSFLNLSTFIRCNNFKYCFYCVVRFNYLFIVNSSSTQVIVIFVQGFRVVSRLRNAVEYSFLI